MNHQAWRAELCDAGGGADPANDANPSGIFGWGDIYSVWNLHPRRRRSSALQKTCHGLLPDRF